MSNPNPEVYGTQETWSKCAVFYAVGEGNPTTKTIAPQINVWDSASQDRRKGTLSRAITAGKITAGVPIDPTICPCGQDATVSCFGKIGLFKNHSDTDANKTPDKIVTYDSPVNWYFSEIWAYLPEGRAYRPQLADRESDLCRWSPNGDLTSSTNQNRYITPFVYYQLKSIFASIVVNTITGYDNYGRPITATVSLEGWKNNYPTRKILSAILKLKGVSAQTGGNITYIGANLDPELSVGVSLLNGIDGITDYYTYYVDRQQDVRLFGNLYANAFNTGDTFYMLAYDMFENMEVKSAFISGVTDGGWNVWQEIPYSETNYEKILQMAACFGIPFSPTSKTQFAAEFTDNDLYLPVIDENGIAHGEYTHGLRNVANSLYDLDGIRDINYNPAQKTDPNTYSNTSHFYNVSVGGGNKRYSLSGFLGVDSLMSDLWALTTTLSADDFSNFDNKIRADMLVSDPIDSIVSLLCFPFIIPHNENSEPIKLGKYSLQTQGHAVTAGSYTINFNGVKLFPRFGGCYLDYEPYTNYEVYVPFCGTIPIRAADILGHTLNIKLVVDLYTGSCTGFILADDLVIETIVGTIAITIPITGIDSATINSQIVNANLNYKSALYSSSTAIGSTLSMGGFFSALTNPADTVNKIAQTQIAEDKAKYDLTHIPTQPHMIGSSSPVIGWCCDTTARVLIYYPTGDVINDSKPPSLITDKIAEFGNMHGFATVDTGKVNNYHGFTMGTLRTEGIACTESERQRLKALFATGVILP